MKHLFMSSFFDLELEFLIATYREFVEAAAASLGLLTHACVTADYMFPNTQNLPKSPRISQNFPESTRIYQNLPESPRISKNLQESPRVSKNLL